MIPKLCWQGLLFCQPKELAGTDRFPDELSHHVITALQTLYCCQSLCFEGLTGNDQQLKTERQIILDTR